jgi:plastocyanin
MATVYLKKVSSSTRSLWVSGTSYVAGDRVYFQSPNLRYLKEDGLEYDSWRTYVCLKDNTSTTYPDVDPDPTNWAEVGATKEYPYHSVDGSFLAPESYFEALNSRWTTSGENGMLFRHLRRGESEYSLGRLIITGDEINPIFKIDTSVAFIGFSIEPDPSIGRFGIVTLGTNAKIGSYASHSAPTTQYATIKNCDVYLSSNNSYIVGGIYNNLNKIEFTDCTFTSKASEVGYADTSSATVVLGNRTFLGFNRCLFFFPDKQIQQILYDSQSHSTGVGSFIKSCTFVFDSITSNYLFQSLKPNTEIKDNIFYFNQSSDPSVAKKVYYGSTTFPGLAENNCAYISDGSPIDLTNSGGFISVNPQLISPLNRDGSRLRPSSPLIGGIQTGNTLATKHPNGVWVDHNHTPVQASYSYILDGGDGTNYLFSGDATGSDPELTVNTQDTLTFTNNTGGHPLAIYNSQGLEVASESGGTTTFTPTYVDIYYYQCTAPGHQNMSGNIVVSQGTLGSYGNPFGRYYDAIDAGYHDSSATLLFKKGDHELYFQNPGGYGSANPSISSSFPGGLFFIGEDPVSTRFTTGNNLNGYSAFYVGSFTGSPQSQTPLTIEGMGFYINNTSSYLNRGLFSGIHWKSFTLKNSKVNCDLTGAINSGLFDYFSSVAPAGYEFNLSGCEINVPLSDNNGPGGSFLSGDPDIKYTVNSCSFVKLDGYNYVHNGPSPIMVGGAFNSLNGSEIKDCIFYSNTGGDFRSSSSIASGVFSSCIIHSTTDSFTNLPEMDINSAVDPLFIDTLAGSEDLRLRPSSVAIGGLAKEPTNVYYLQPDNPFNGDGSQKDASEMAADGDPGPFNEFKEIIAAGVPYGSTIIIVNGTYDWTESFGRSPSTNVSSNTWYAYTCAGYNYIAETPNEVIFDANLNPSNVFIYKPYGGTLPTSGGGAVGTFLDLDTTFTGIQFNNMIGLDNATRNQIGSISGSAGLGSCTFKNCKFLGHINTGGSIYPWTGGGRVKYSSTMRWENCEISIVFDNAGSLLGGGDGFADDQYHGAWSWRNCTFYIPTGLTTFNGRNAANGTYVSPSIIFGAGYSQIQREFKNNIIHIPNGTASIGVNSSSKLPKIENNCFNGVSPGISPDPDKYEDQILQGGNLIDVHPSFVDANNNNFNLRPSSILIGKGK